MKRKLHLFFTTRTGRLTENSWRDIFECNGLRVVLPQGAIALHSDPGKQY